MRFLVLALAALVGCDKAPCRDSIAVPGRPCHDVYRGAQLVLERTSPLAPPLAMCRCPVETIPEKETR